MYISKVQVTNFRLLADATLALEKHATVIVGRNNSGKTSLSEVARRFLQDNQPAFQLADFSNDSYRHFCTALEAYHEGKEDSELRELLPSIQLRLHFTYDPSAPCPALEEFIIDLNPECTEAIVVAEYSVRDGVIAILFEDLLATELDGDGRVAIFRTLAERVPHFYSTKIYAVDPSDPANRRVTPHSSLRHLLDVGFVNAQRGLDDNTSQEVDILARVLEGLFTSAAAPTSSAEERLIVEDLHTFVQSIQERLDTDFNTKLTKLLPTLKSFGYPGLTGSDLATETTLDAGRLLKNHTKVRYAGHEGILLPESYNGLGVRNLVFILLQIVSFYRAFRAAEVAPGIHLVFIEEPEAHLHPQMQEVFIRQLSAIANELSSQDGEGLSWPVQFVVSTHSSHIANEAGFESIRYFLSSSCDATGLVQRTVVKDLREGLKDTPEAHRDFLHQYLTLTRCDLFFADKAILVEGTSERLMLPAVIRQLEKDSLLQPSLSNQYFTVLEVGGAYAHLFFTLLEFLELRTLIITDIDAVVTAGGCACNVSSGTATSNACIKAWFAGESCSPSSLITKSDSARTKGLIQIAYQRPEVPGGPCGRTFEDAFMLANRALFDIVGTTASESEEHAREKASKEKKSEFALRHAVGEQTWTSPAYIRDGLVWLSSLNDGPVLPPDSSPVAEGVASDD